MCAFRTRRRRLNAAQTAGENCNAKPAVPKPRRGRGLHRPADEARSNEYVLTYFKRHTLG